MGRGFARGRMSSFRRRRGTMYRLALEVGVGNCGSSKCKPFYVFLGPVIDLVGSTSLIRTPLTAFGRCRMASWLR